MSRNKDLKKRVMRHVYIEYYVSHLAQRLAFIVPIVSLLFLLTLISVVDIWHNISQINPKSFFNFTAIALRDTETAVKLSFGAFILSAMASLSKMFINLFNKKLSVQIS